MTVQVPKIGEHPELDLNAAAFPVDAKIASRAYPDSEFIVQICDLLNHTDKAS